MDAPFWVLVSCLIAIGTVPTLALAVLFYMAARFRQKEADRKGGRQVTGPDELKAREHLAWLVRRAYEAGMRAGWESVRREVMEALRVGR